MTAGVALDALTVECPTCRAQVRAACYYAPQPGTWWPRDPHPARIEAARALLLSTMKRSESRWLALAEVWGTLDESSQEVLAEVARVLAADPAQVVAQLGASTNCPLATAAGGRVLQHGARERACVGPSADQTVQDHLHHAMEHLQIAMVRPGERDDTTGELHLVHAARRADLAVELLLREAAAKKEGR